ncbi:hypothetical protein [Streptomyces smyrnaeus]|uniref:hypothetical protein n=1 Tax=Streptomyces smyrnaeus TaxID=1387713 RepID=UPI000C1985EA
MSEDAWAAITEWSTVLAVLAVYLGGVVGFSRSLPRALHRDPSWRRDTRRSPASSALTLTLLIVVWPVSIIYLAFRVATRRRRRAR